MTKNLVIGCIGEDSCYRTWVSSVGELRNYDLMLVNYTGKAADKLKANCEYYFEAKGAKFNIISQIFDFIPKDYDFIFIPDDDLVLFPEYINKFFEIAHQYDLKICQPGITGYYSLLITLAVPQSVLRYTNYVEIMCPCFSREAFEICKPTFNCNKSGWGIDLLWNKLLGYPKKSIAIVDCIVASHTRPCFHGDTYVNNNIVDPIKDVFALVEEHGLSWDKIVYETVVKEDEWELDPTERFWPKW